MGTTQASRIATYVKDEVTLRQLLETAFLIAEDEVATHWVWDHEDGLVFLKEMGDPRNQVGREIAFVADVTTVIQLYEVWFCTLDNTDIERYAGERPHKSAQPRAFYVDTAPEGFEGKGVICAIKPAWVE